MNDPGDDNAVAPTHAAPLLIAWPRGDGEMAARIRNHDWCHSALGPAAGWPHNLRHATQLTLDSIEPTCLLWTAAGILIYNDAYIAILNIRHPAALGQPLARVWPELAELETAQHAHVWRTGCATLIQNRPNVIFTQHIPRERWFTVSATPVRGETSAVEGIIQRLFDTTEHAESQRRLRHAVAKLDEHQAGLTMQLALSDAITDESARQREQAQLKLRDIEMHQRALIEGLPQLIWRADSRGHWTWSSPQWTRYTGLSLDDSLSEGWLDAVHPDDRPRARTAWGNAVSQGVFDVEYRIGPAATGPYRWFQTRAAPIRNVENGVIEWLGTSTDVDELRQARERQILLVAELQHRTRNLIGVVRSLASMTARDCLELGSFHTQFGERLEALSRAQGLLSRADEEPITLGALLRMELDALGTSAVAGRVTLQGPEVRLKASVVQTFALAIHELATNALKHGALHTSAGRLAVSWTLQGESSERTLRLHWQEMGSEPVPAREAQSGYGRELLEQMLPYVLDAKTTYEITTSGAQCTIELPARLDAATGLPKIGAAQ
ncbi:MAG: PAS domain-containing protein [Proteobacteria bacterium]|nr:PAS domain-containing protein [Pseudomonadota bacterium]